MKTIIAGSRTIGDYSLVEDAVKACGWDVTTVICGGATGVDTLGAEWAIKNRVTIKSYPAKWNVHGKKAGYIRNVEMAEVGDALILIWDGTSRGSKMMKDIATKKGLRIYEKVV